MSDNMIPSRTYKIRPPIYADALYFTVVGEENPEAFFFNSKSMESFQWIIQTMSSMSRRIELGDSMENIIRDMKGQIDPNGGYVIPDGSGREVKSVVHHLGLVLERHIEDVGKCS